MSQARIMIVVLGVLLIASNAIWAYALVFPRNAELKPEYGCSPSEHRDELERTVIGPLTAAIASAAEPGATKDSVIAAASGATKPSYRFCIHESDVIIDKRFGLRFDQTGKLNGASVTICPITDRPDA